MADRDMSPEAREQWSDRNQTLRHSGTKQPLDDQALLHDPSDYSAVGGPDDEPAYGRSRSDNGHYPFNPYDGPYDCDSSTHLHERGGYIKLHAADHGSTDIAQARYRDHGPRQYRSRDERLREAIRERLLHDDHIDTAHIDVAVSNGHVTLQGSVAGRVQQQQVETLAYDVYGVTGVTNALRPA